jgi:hypothetical protein
MKHKEISEMGHENRITEGNIRKIFGLQQYHADKF